jgi:glycosyltransferase involved in cell wall biosynthesis
MNTNNNDNIHNNEFEISFVVIGKNQEKTIIKCLESIYSTCRYNKITNFEIIYVDSKSKDRTIEIIKNKFYDIKIILLTGKINAAIGRNTGAKNSNGNVLYFIDGDMEINKYFFKKVYSTEKGLLKNVVSGKVQDYFYNENFDGIIKIRDDRFGIKKNSYKSFLGGIFIIKREIFFNIGGFTNNLKENEDKDLALKLCINGEYIYYLNSHIAKHHTIDYNNFSRLFKRFLNGNMFFPSLIFRKYFSKKVYLKSFLKLQKFTLLFIISILLSFKIHFLFIFLYPFLILIKNFKLQSATLIEDLVGTFLLNISFILGIFLFHPKKITDSDIEYKILN